MPWLVRDGMVLASVEVAGSRPARARGLLGRDGIDGALLLPSTRSVHTFGMRFAIDVAFCDADLQVLRVRTLRRNRLALPVRRARSVIETEADVMRHWELRPGDRLELRGDGPDGDEPVAGG
ncbi:MAG: DUF192 domain-containing protein [Acidimicrobiales bacterium]|jgi:hypothetical protein|nr:DUF192 domain-containing protein [Acidimicrobiales bacterium]